MHYHGRNLAAMVGSLDLKPHPAMMTFLVKALMTMTRPVLIGLQSQLVWFALVLTWGACSRGSAGNARGAERRRGRGRSLGKLR